MERTFIGKVMLWYICNIRRTWAHRRYYSRQTWHWRSRRRRTCTANRRINTRGHLSDESRIWALTKYTWTSLWITWDSTAVRRHCTDWYEIWALTDHEIYYIKIELDLRKFSNGPFSETEKGFWVNPTPGGSQCTGLSPTLSWKWPRATLSPSFGPFFERNHSFGVKMVS